MKITIYELLGMIKEDKAPNKIKYINSIWEYDENTKDYINDDIWLIYSMNSIGLTEREVEIIEEPQKHKIPRNIFLNKTDGDYYIDAYSYEQVPLERKKLSIEEVLIINKINEIIDYLEEIK